MQFNIPTKVRLAIYIANGLLAILGAYLLDKGMIGQPELNLLAALTVFSSGLASLNVPVK